MFTFQGRSSPSRLALAALCLLSFLNLSLVSAIDLAYCSTLNTASTDKNSSVFQSNGLCKGFCIDNYAFSVLQGDDCWCSDYAPATTDQGCNVACPGYPPDNCGGSGVYAYIALTKQPSGTEGSNGASPTAQPDQSNTLATSPRATTSPPPSSSTWTPTPIISLETVTGEVKTTTVTPTAPPGSLDANSFGKDSKKSGLGTGGAVGLTVGLVALIAIIALMVLYYLRKRKRERAEAYNNVSGGGSMAGFAGGEGGVGPIPTITMSQNSRYVLGTDGRQVVERWEQDQNQPALRKSRLMPVDPRLDPFAPVYQRGGNKSRESVNTIQDNHDYSRRVAPNGPILRALNPDTD